jgi:hypothetical protein
MASKNHSFLSFAHAHEKAHKGLWARQMVEEIVKERNDPIAAQRDLAIRFKSVVDDYQDNWGDIDPRQVVRAHLACAWRHLQSLDDGEWDAIADDLGDEIGALKALCDPDDWGPHENTPIDH